MVHIILQGELPNVLPSGPARPAPPGSNTGWAVQPAEKMKYDKLFDSLEPVNGLIPGNKVGIASSMFEKCAASKYSHCTTRVYSSY